MPRPRKAVPRHLPGILPPPGPVNRMSRDQYRKAARNPKELEDALSAQIAAMRLPIPTREYHFTTARGWRFDFAWPDRLVAVEVQGGGWVNGAHSRGSGLESDAEKYSAAAILGWRLILCTGKQIKSGEAIGWIYRILGGRDAFR